MMDLFPILADIIERCHMSDIEAFAPDEKIHPGEEVLDVELSPDLKKLFAASRCFSEEFDELVEQLASDESLVMEIARRKSFLEIMDKVFWHELIDNLGFWECGGKGIGLRVGWKVVTFQDRRKEDKEGQPEVDNSGNRRLKQDFSRGAFYSNFFIFYSCRDLPPIAN